mmetsp:Transcript_146362/g.407736  ORF Transcript_146362/g.407736 Transcript_146362/m.407736 type:complete len:125 (+) Transcript_146362:34-408(+)
MDTEAWYCLCIDEMQKACREIEAIQKNRLESGETPDIQHYGETKCMQAMGCYDPFEQVCESWKTERRRPNLPGRCSKLQTYTNELKKHQRASLIQRANRSASGAAGGVARLDSTVGSKAHQCNH